MYRDRVECFDAICVIALQECSYFTGLLEHLDPLDFILLDEDKYEEILHTIKTNLGIDFDSALWGKAERLKDLGTSFFVFVWCKKSKKKEENNCLQNKIKSPSHWIANNHTNILLIFHFDDKFHQDISPGEHYKSNTTHMSNMAIPNRSKISWDDYFSSLIRYNEVLENPKHVIDVFLQCRATISKNQKELQNRTN